MKKRGLSLFLAVAFCFCAVLNLTVKATEYSASRIVDYVNNKVGESYANGYCLRFVDESFQNVYGYREYSCCAYKSGDSYIDSSSKDIPLGACVFFGGSSVTCSSCGNKAGHIGIYIGDGNIVHAWDGQLISSSIDYIVSRGYPYRGYGWLCDVALTIETIPELGESVNVGTDFFAYIINYSSWLPIAVTSDRNVVLEKETGMQNQFWKFTLLSDGSYKIISLLDGRSLDVDYEKAEPETNIKTDIFFDNDAQHWYIYGTDGNYKLKAKCTDCVMDVGGGSLSEGANIQTFTYNNTKAQNFQIYKVDSTFALGKPIDIGENFVAYIVNDSSSLPIAVTSDRNIVLDVKKETENQLWHFSKLNDGSYKIISLLDGRSLDVDCAKNELGTNIKSELFTDNDAQHWYIYGKEGNYKLKAKCTDFVMDVGGGSLSEGANIQTYVYNDTDAQKFDIIKSTILPTQTATPTPIPTEKPTATPTATPTPTVKPTPTPTATPSPTPTPTVKPTATPSPTVTPTKCFKVTEYDSYADVENTASTSRSAVVIIAKYNGDALEKVSFAKVNFASGEKRTFMFDTGGDYKVFVWDSINGMFPLDI